jgi:23S rRNA (guanosine2251-2'-O)-methyltransferase
VVLEGRVSIEAALEGGVRPVHEILSTNPADRRLAHLRAAAAAHGVPIRRIPQEEVASLATGRSHGGTLAIAGARRYLEMDELLARLGPQPFVVMLDGLEDPFNLGQAIRSLFAAGTDGLVVRARSWENAAGTVARASAGASEVIPTATVDGPQEAADACRQRGLQIACAASRPDAIPLHSADLTGPTFLLIGGERRGITRSFVDDADVRLRIPYGRRGAHALGAAAAAAVIAFEALRQRSEAASPRVQVSRAVRRS